MRGTVERLRLGLLVGALLLVAVIASFLGYARLRAHRFLKDLPGRMGAELRQETNGFTWSQSREGRTVFTIHAAKAIQRKDGKVTLHDVGIVLYGRTGAGVVKPGAAGVGGRRELADRIYGKEFEYDQTAGVVRAMGEVHIDLEAPIPVDSKAKMDFAAGKEAGHDPAVAPEDDRVVHVKTSGLVFLQKLGVASTGQEIEFAYRGLKGQAQGADYNSDTGVLVLQSAVTVTGLQDDRPAVLRATHAEMNRLTNQVRLTQARYSSTVGGSSAGDSGHETASADEVTFFGAEGTSDAGAGERLEARGSVVLTDGPASMTGARGEMLLDPTNRPRSATLSGGIAFQSEEKARTLHGTATEGHGDFGAGGRLEKVLMTGNVAVHEEDEATGPERQASKRNLTSGRLQLALGTAPGGRLWLKEAVADGDARLQMVTTGGSAVGTQVPADGKTRKGAETSALWGDHLRAQLQLVDGAGQLTRVEGLGHTALRRGGEKGEDTSTGNSLLATFRRADAKGGATQEIESAVQVGEVTMTHVDAGAGAHPQQATAERGVYEGAADRLTLTGGVRLTDAGSVLLADRVSVLRESGDATATGSVRASYLGAGAGGAPNGEPVHVLAERGELKRGAGEATFYGREGAGGAGGSSLARLWQGGSQVEAAVIELGQAERTLRAHGAAGGAKGAVRTVLTSGSGGGGRTAGAAGGGADAAGQVAAPVRAGKAEVIRVTSRELVYSDAERRADFTGGVVLQDAQGTMRSQRAEVFLEPAEARGQGSKSAAGGAGAGAGPAARGAGNKTANALGTTGLMGGAVERIVASGGVEIEQPLRRGTGEQVVYTAADGFFVMTGTPATPPRVVDQAHGTVVGQLLRFNTGDNSVVVSGDAGQSAGSRNRVRTETRVRQAR